jgi:hypothetical protein
MRLAAPPPAGPASVDASASPVLVAPDRRWERAYLAMYAVYVVLGLAARSLGWVHGDAVWFVEAARRVLNGSFDVYSYRAAFDVAPPEGISYSYSPLMAMLIAPFVGLADGLGWGQAWAERLMAIPLLAADVLAMQQLRRLAREWRPTVDERWLFLGVLVSLGLTGFWLVSAYYGHDEGLVLVFLVLALRLTPRNLLLGGACAGLALAAKHTAALQLLPVAFVLLAGGLRDRHPVEGTSKITGGRADPAPLAAALAWGGVALGVFAAFLAPAVLRNPGAAWYALVTLPSRLELFGPGLPVWIDQALKAALSPPDHTRAHALLMTYANLALFGVVAVALAAAVWWARARGRPVGLVDAHLLGLVAFAGVAQIVFSKWAGGHYYQLPLALVFLWDVVRATSRSDAGSSGSFPWIGIGAAIAFRSITPFGAFWLKEALLFALFAVLATITLRSVKDRP